MPYTQVLRIFLISVILYLISMLIYSIYKTKKECGEFSSINILRIWVITSTLGVVAPIMWVHWFWEWQLHSERIKTFDIVPLNLEHRITLRNLHFEEGNFKSKANQEFSGFRFTNRDGASFEISYAGHVTVWGKPDAKDKFVIGILKDLIELRKPAPKRKPSEVPAPGKE